MELRHLAKVRNGQLLVKRIIVENINTTIVNDQLYFASRYVHVPASFV